MNPLLERLHPYPFERLRELTASIRPPAHLRPISLGIGEPRHPTPRFIEEAMVASLPGLATYPSTAGEPALREAAAGWVARRYGVTLDPATQLLPVNGSREALFALAQTVIDPSRPGATVVCPNPFYQIYEGAALLAGAGTAFANSDPARNFASRWDDIDEATWARTQLLYVCSPGNPTGAVMPLQEWRQLFALSERHGFVIASDECYSEIYFRDEPPLGALQEEVPALPHLPRQRHEHGGPAREHGRLGRRGTRGSQPRALSPEVRPRHAHAGRGDGREVARRRLLPVVCAAAVRIRRAR
jgi:N-succinyldiaminopimelate aminotransferase